MEEIINCLFRLSVSIQNPAPHDRLKEMRLVDKSHYEQFDIAHVREVIPTIPREYAVRLGKVITRRRQWFAARRSHHQTRPSGADNAQTGPHDPRTTHGELAERGVISFEGDASDSDRTETTMGSIPGLGGRPEIPPLPAEGHEGPFECPFCYTMISAPTTRAWKFVYPPLFCIS